MSASSIYLKISSDSLYPVYVVLSQTEMHIKVYIGQNCVIPHVNYSICTLGQNRFSFYLQELHSIRKTFKEKNFVSTKK